MKTKISIPNAVKDMTVGQLPFYLALAELAPQDGKINESLLEDMEPIEVADLNTLFFSAEPGEFDIYTKESNKQILAEIALSCARYEVGEIQPEITLNGQKYIFVPDYSKMPVSFHRDISRADFKENPLDLFGFCYLEEGMLYNETDSNKNILNEYRKRGEAFRDSVTLSDYLDLQGFFLESYNVYRPYLKVKEARKNQRLGTGKKV